MSYKKINASLDFIQKAEPKKKLIHLQTKMPKQTKLAIQKEIKGVFSLVSFIKNSLLEELKYFSNEDLILIYKKASWQKVSMKDYVKEKLGLIELAQQKDILEDNKDINSLIVVKEEEKKAIEEIAYSLKLSCLQYSKIKLIATYELKDMFSFEEIVKLHQEAKKYNISLKEYISLKLK